MKISSDDKSQSIHLYFGLQILVGGIFLCLYYGEKGMVLLLY